MSKNGKPPGFFFLVKDYLSDVHVMNMTARQEGSYTRLLFICSNEGAISADKSELMGLLKKDATEEDLEVILQRFVFKRGNNAQLVSKKLKDEERKRKIYLKKKSEAGKKGAKARAT